MAMTLAAQEQDRMLQELAAAQGVSKQEAAVRAIEESAKRRVDLRDRVLKRIVGEDGELLDLLSK